MILTASFFVGHMISAGLAAEARYTSRWGNRGPRKVPGGVCEACKNSGSIGSGDREVGATPGVDVDLVRRVLGTGGGKEAPGFSAAREF